MVEEKSSTSFSEYLQVCAYVIVVIAIITLVVYILARCGLWPGLLERPILAHEAAAGGNLGVIANAEQSYKSRWDRYGSLKEIFEDPDHIPLREATSPERARFGYYYVLTSSKDNWSCVAMPAKPGETGKRSFYIDETRFIRSAPCKNDSDPPASSASAVYYELK